MATATLRRKKSQSADPPTKVRRRERPTAELTRRGPTGPRTARGKQKSRDNAIKHGVFAVGLVGSESWSDYHAHVNGLVESLQPVGKLEEILVEKLAMLVWRYRRLLKAEAAEIERSANAERDPSHLEKAFTTRMIAGNMGSLHQAFLTHNDSALVAAIGGLEKLQRGIKEKGLDWDRDRETLAALFGTKNKGNRESLLSGSNDEDENHNAEPDGPVPKKYRELTLALQAEPAPGSARASSAASAKVLLEWLDQLSEPLRPLLLRWDTEREVNMKLKVEAALVPGENVAGRLLRYEGTLERAIDRTLTQIERLQRMRLGQAVPPPVKVELTR